MKFSALLCALCLAIILVAIQATPSVEELKQTVASIFNQDGSLTDELFAAKCGSGSTNLKSLSGKTFKGYDATDPNHYEYTLDFCDNAKESQCKAQNGSLCQYDSTLQNKFVNALASFTASPEPTYSSVGGNGTVQVVFKNGAPCYDVYTTVIPTVTMLLTCSKTSNHQFSIVEPTTCNYQITFPTEVICPGYAPSGLSGGALVLIVVFALVAIYIAVGCVVCVTKFGKKFGPDALPHREFWCALPGLFFAGVGFAIGKVKGLLGSKTITSTAGEYEEV